MPSSGPDRNPLVVRDYMVCDCVMNHVVVDYRSSVARVIRIGAARAEGQHCGNGKGD